MNQVHKSLTSQHNQILQSELKNLRGKPWSLSHPVFLLNRCWLRLEKIKLYELTHRMPPDNSAEAPELILYQQLLNSGCDPLLAIQECWQEFGMEDFHRALRNCWASQEKGNHGWTFRRYVELFNQYKYSVECLDFTIPLIILGRTQSKENHKLEWILNKK